LAVCPYYNRPSQAGIAGHFNAVAAATDLPVVLYDIPVRTGRRIEPSTMAAIAATSANVVAVKDASGDLSTAASSISAFDGRLEWYSGDDSLTLALAALGAVGVISVASHWAAPHFATIFHGVASGDLASARAANAALFSSFAFQGGDLTPNPLPAKAMMRHLGFAVGQCRLPMGDAEPSLDAAAAALAAEFGRS
jgi:4-hydroxy-tetrahydrodipicolinate synthase